MPKLSDTQAIILSAASQRRDGNLLPLPGSLRGGAAAKVVAALFARRFAEERVLDSTTKADAVWRNLDDGRRVLLLITDAGRAALGIDVASAPGGAVEAVEAASAGQGRRARSRAAEAAEKAAPRRTREATKQALLIGLLDRPEGATIEEIVAATGWQPHTVRGAFAGALKKRLGLDDHVGEARGARPGLPDNPLRLPAAAALLGVRRPSPGSSTSGHDCPKRLLAQHG